MPKRIDILLLLSLGVVSASATASPVAAPDPATSTSASDYRLGVDDRVRMTVFGEDSLTNEYPVGPSGMLSLPLIGDVPAKGRTIAEVTGDVRQRLADGFLKDPNVSLTITSFRPFNILGEVAKPGSYPYREGMTVMAAVATAEGFTYRAQKRYVFIKHEGDPAEVRVELTPTLAIRPGDTVRFGERYF